MTLKLSNTTALVTGASRGIGKAAALALAQAGAYVLIHYGRSGEQAEEIARGICAEGGKATPLGADLSTMAGILSLAEQVKAITPRLDTVVLNAGISKAGGMEAHTQQDFDNLFATNVRGPFFLLQQLLPVLGDGSSVVVVTSVVAEMTLGFPGQAGVPTLPAYAATKGALETLVKHWSAMLGPKGIRVNAVAPGIIATDMSNFTKTEAGRQLAMDIQALKRIGEPSDVADVIAFLASHGARWITGQSIAVDGGSRR